MAFTSTTILGLDYPSWIIGGEPRAVCAAKAGAGWWDPWKGSLRQRVEGSHILPHKARLLHGVHAWLGLCAGSKGTVSLGVSPERSTPLLAQVVIPVVSVQMIKKHKMARLLPNGLAITTNTSQKVSEFLGQPSLVSLLSYPPES